MKSTLSEDELKDALAKCASVTNLSHSGREDPSEIEVRAAEIERSARREDDPQWRQYRIKLPNRRESSDRPFAAIVAYRMAKDISLDDIETALRRAKTPIDRLAVLDSSVHPT